MAVYENIRRHGGAAGLGHSVVFVSLIGVVARMTITSKHVRCDQNRDGHVAVCNPPSSHAFSHPAHSHPHLTSGCVCVLCLASCRADEGKAVSRQLSRSYFVPRSLEGYERHLRQIHCEGYLQRQSRTTGTWRRRWFLLKVGVCDAQGWDFSLIRSGLVEAYFYLSWGGRRLATMWAVGMEMPVIIHSVLVLLLLLLVSLSAVMVSWR